MTESPAFQALNSQALEGPSLDLLASDGPRPSAALESPPEGITEHSSQVRGSPEYPDLEGGGRALPSFPEVVDPTPPISASYPQIDSPHSEGPTFSDEVDMEPRETPTSQDITQLVAILEERLKADEYGGQKPDLSPQAVETINAGRWSPMAGLDNPLPRFSSSPSIGLM